MKLNCLPIALGLILTKKVAAGVALKGGSYAEDTRALNVLRGRGRPTQPPSSVPTNAPSDVPTPFPTHAPSSSPSNMPSVSVEACKALTSIVINSNADAISCPAPCCETNNGEVLTFPYTSTVEEIYVRSTSLVRQLHFPALKQCGRLRVNYLPNLDEVTLPKLDQAKSIQFINNPKLMSVDLPFLREISTTEDDYFDADLKVMQNSVLTGINAPRLTSISCYGRNRNANLYVRDNTILASFTFDALANIYGDDGGEAMLYIRNNANLNDFFFPKLRSIIGEGYYGALLIDGNDSLIDFEFPLLSDIGPDAYAEFSVTSNGMLTKVEMPSLRTVNYIFFSGSTSQPQSSLVDIRLPKWEGGGECSSLYFYDRGTACLNGQDVVIRLCSLQSLEYGVDFFGGTCYQVRGSEYAEAQCSAMSPTCTIFQGNPPKC